MNRLVRAACFSLAILLSACAASLEGDAGSDKALQSQLARAAQTLAASPQPRVIYAGFAMHSQSRAFAADVRAAARFARQLDPQAVVVTLINPVLFGGGDEPLATRANIERALTELGRLARDQDKVILLFSSHGAPGLLALNISNRNDKPLQAAELRRWLQLLQGKPTVLLLSACYSGSFIDTLRGSSRIIFTAAAGNRNSFGCNFESDGTWFIQGLLPRDPDLSLSLDQLMANASQAIGERERRLKVGPPSQPQAYVGSAMQALAKVPLSGLREAPFAAPPRTAATGRRTPEFSP